MFNIPTQAWPFVFAVIAAVAAFLFGRQRSDAPFGLVSVVLYAVAAGCVVIGVVTTWLQHAS